MKTVIRSLALLLSLAVAAPAPACTSLIYTDADGRIYYGRTLELALDLPYVLAHFPAGHAFSSDTGGASALDFTARYPFIAITMPDVPPVPGAPVDIGALKAVEGANAAGLTFSLLSYPSASGPQNSVEMTKKALAAVDLGSWALAQYATVAEVKAALAAQSVVLTPLKILAGAEAPFHYVVHDRSGASIVIEFNNGQQAIYDNPVGVMTNGPAFPWHLTNLGNYSFLSNIDQSTGTFGALAVSQPDSGIATAGLPSSNTSVGRFIRAAYYAQFAQKVSDPDAAVRTLAHVMNNFDRPIGITVDSGQGGAEGLTVVGASDATAKSTSEFTTWTSLADLDRNLFFVRSYGGLNYSKIDLNALAGSDKVLVLPLADITALSDATGALAAAAAP